MSDFVSLHRSWRREQLTTVIKVIEVVSSAKWDRNLGGLSSPGSVSVGRHMRQIGITQRGQEQRPRWAWGDLIPFRRTNRENNVRHRPNCSLVENTYKPSRSNSQPFWPRASKHFNNNHTHHTLQQQQLDPGLDRRLSTKFCSQKRTLIIFLQPRWLFLRFWRGRMNR